MQLSRRHFIQSLGAVGAASTLPMSLKLGAALAPTVLNYKSMFNDALANDQRLIGFKDVNKNFALKQMDVEGTIPKALQGSLFRNGPAKLERGDIRYQHLFEGDGMLQQFKFADGKVYHRGKFVQTPKFQQEQRAGKFLYSAPDTKIPNSLAVVDNDTVNTANTNVIAVGDDLWTLWEAGSPARVNPQSLDFQGLVNLGEHSRYGNKLKGLPFSAHPKIDGNGDIFNFGLHNSGRIAVYHLGASGVMKNVSLINANYKGGMLHDFLITEKYVLLVLPSLVQSSSDDGYFERIKFNKNVPMRVLVLDKNTLQQVREYQLPPAFVFHFGNAWTEQDGTICFDACLYQDADALHKLSRLMIGKAAINTRSQSVFIRLKTNGSVEITSTNINSEFPRLLPNLTGIKNKHLYHLSSSDDALWSESVSRIDTTTGKQEKYRYGSEFLVEEHVPISLNGCEKGDYVIGTALHFPSKRTCISVFEADNLSAGPMGRAWLPYHLPLGFHGNFMCI